MWHPTNSSPQGRPSPAPFPAPALALAVLALLGAAPVVHAQQAPRATLSTDALAALSFRNIGPATMSGRFVDLAVVERDPQVFYAASATGGLWKTTDNGISFTTLFEDEGTHSIGDVVVHQRDTAIVWVGTGERASRQSSSWGDGVYKSVDGGSTWRNMGLRDSHHIGRIVLHPEDPNTVYVAAMGHLWGPNEERGLYRSTDGGESWQRILYVDENTGVVDVAMDPSDPSVVYASTYQRRRRPFGFNGGGPGSGLHKSTDGGATWRELTSGLPEGNKGRIGISIYRKDPRIVYVSVEQGLRYNASTAYEERKAGVYRSQDRGESWTHMSDWNPRPMYASQILVDPSDDQRVYMLNAYSFSDDGGKTFTVPRQSLHGDDRLVWVNPRDSRHVMKADDGGIGISYDRGLTWLYLQHIPVSQYYRIRTDMRTPYHVYGGLQDNGSWSGPSATYRSEGILNSDWIRWGGGDGFLNVVDTTDNRTLYTESQYLGLDRVDMVTGERVSIRPGDPTGAISARRNWNTWGDMSLPDERLGNAMAPANWDGPFILSPHDSRTIYAGTNILWKSTDRGNSWTALGDLTRGVDRRSLAIMAEPPTATTLSLDDGIPYWPTLTQVAESPLRRGLLYVGTDDGNVQVSADDGATWRNVSERVPGLPRDAWVSGIEPSAAVEGRVYAVFNNYRNNDFANYVYRSEDRGQSWTSIDGNLPPNRVARTIREDPRNPDVLYLGTELGLFLSVDRGRSWVEVRSGLPRAAVNDLVVHPRDNDLVLGTHGRGVWILDQVNALQEVAAAATASGPHLFSMEPAHQIRYRREGAHTGDMFFAGENPPAGAIIDYWLPREGGSPAVTVHDRSGAQVARVPATDRAGMNRIVWNLRHAEPGRSGEAEEDEDEAPRGPLVVPGTYTVRLQVGAERREGTVEVREDPRIQVSPEARAAWTRVQLEIVALRERAGTALAGAKGWVDRIEEGEDVGGREVEIRDLHRALGELRSRLIRLGSEVADSVSPLTADQRSELDFYRRMVDELERELAALG